MVTSLQALGHTVPFQDSSAPVQIHFSQPTWYEFFPNQYKIGYTPWESTELPEDWLPRINQVDELWATSPWVKNVYENAGVKPPVYVYEHGVEKIWTPLRRTPNRKLRFLHMGEPAPRKSGQMALDAFRAAFGDRDDVELTIKANIYNTTRAYQGTSIIGQPQEIYNNVKLIVKTMDTNELISLVHQHHALVYPSWGEGFGLIPLQALATGMPVLSTYEWAPYARFLLKPLRIESRLVDTKWPEMHPGKMYEPDFDSLVQAYLTVYDRYRTLSGKAYLNSYKIREEYNWLRLTNNAWNRIVKKFENFSS